MPLKKKHKSTNKMIDQNIIEQVKQVPITSYLLSKNFFPAAKQDGKNQYSYCSPITNENTASFFVNEKENVFNDFSSGEKGDIIRLAMILERINFPTAVKRLQSFMGSSLVNFDTAKPAGATINDTYDTTVITFIRTLQHPALLNYAELTRKIPFSFISPYCRQIHFQRADKKTGMSKNYFGIGFRTDAGSWAVRSENYKSWVGQATISTLPVEGSTCINLFEGFFSFLSACVWFKTTKMHNTTIVLNSVSHLNHALPALKNAHTVFSFLDNDSAGRKALDRLRKEGVNVIDRSKLYAPHKDFNEFLQTL